MVNVSKSELQQLKYMLKITARLIFYIHKKILLKSESFTSSTTALYKDALQEHAELRNSRDEVQAKSFTGLMLRIFLAKTCLDSNTENCDEYDKLMSSLKPVDTNIFATFKENLIKHIKSLNAKFIGAREDKRLITIVKLADKLTPHSSKADIAAINKLLNELNEALDESTEESSTVIAGGRVANISQETRANEATSDKEASYKAVADKATAEEKALEEKVAAEKAATAEKAGAEKAAVEKAATAEKAAAEKAAVEKAAAEKAAAEARAVAAEEKAATAEARTAEAEARAAETQAKAAAAETQAKAAKAAAEAEATAATAAKAEAEAQKQVNKANATETLTEAITAEKAGAEKAAVEKAATAEKAAAEKAAVEKAAAEKAAAEARAVAAEEKAATAEARTAEAEARAETQAKAAAAAVETQAKAAKAAATAVETAKKEAEQDKSLAEQAKAQATAAENRASQAETRATEARGEKETAEKAANKAVADYAKLLDDKGVMQEQMETAQKEAKEAIEAIEALKNLQGKLINEDQLQLIKREVHNRNIPTGSDDLNEPITGKEERSITDTKGTIQSYITSVSNNNIADSYRNLTRELDTFSLNMLVSLLTKGYNAISGEPIQRKKRIYLYILILIKKYIVFKALNEVKDNIESSGLFIKEQVDSIEKKLVDSNDEDLKKLLLKILRPIQPLFTHLITLNFKNNENIEKIVKILTDKIDLIIPGEEISTTTKPATHAAGQGRQAVKLLLRQTGGSNLKKTRKKKNKRLEE